MKTDLEAGCIEESGKLSKDCDAMRRMSSYRGWVHPFELLESN